MSAFLSCLGIQWILLLADNQKILHPDPVSCPPPSLLLTCHSSDFSLDVISPPVMCPCLRPKYNYKLGLKITKNTKFKGSLKKKKKTIIYFGLNECSLYIGCGCMKAFYRRFGKLCGGTRVGKTTSL